MRISDWSSDVCSSDLLRVPGHALDVHAICVHLGLREAHRRQQIDQLCALIAETVPKHAPLFVVGDFNDWWLRANPRLQCCGLQEAFMSEHGDRKSIRLNSSH